MPDSFAKEVSPDVRCVNSDAIQTSGVADCTVSRNVGNTGIDSGREDGYDVRLNLLGAWASLSIKGEKTTRKNTPCFELIASLPFFKSRAQIIRPPYLFSYGATP